MAGFFSTQPFMGSVTLLARAPFVALVAWTNGDIATQYRVGTCVLFLATVILLLPAFRLMLLRGQHVLIVLALIAAITLGPATLAEVRWGHPEEMLGAALAVAAVLAAIHRRSVAAGVLAGLAIATKQWGIFAVLPVLMLSPGQRVRVACIAAAVASVFILPMIIGDPTKFIEQNFNTAVAQLGVTPTNVWWPFHRPGFDPTVHQHLNVIPSVLRELSHPLALALVLGLSLLYWRRGADRNPYDALQLLALLFLIRCVLDPLTISYHHVPFVLTIATYEGLRRRGIPVLTLISTAAILLLAYFIAPLNKPDLMNAIYLAWALPTIAYLTVSCFGSRRRVLGSTPLLEPRPRQPALAAAPQ